MQLNSLWVAASSNWRRMLKLLKVNARQSINFFDPVSVHKSHTNYPTSLF
jgi:hypothetical protein